MATLNSVGDLRRALMRLVGTLPDDHGLTARGEDQNEVLDLFLTEGARATQDWLLDTGYHGWLATSDPLVWQDASDGFEGRFAELPDDFLRAYGDYERSALVESDGDSWGRQIHPEEADRRRGDLFYIPNEDEVWLTNGANPPSSVRMLYHRAHPELSDEATAIEIPERSRYLIVAEAAHLAMEENWLPGGQEMRQKITEARDKHRERARYTSKTSRAQREMRKPRRWANRW